MTSDEKYQAFLGRIENDPVVKDLYWKYCDDGTGRLNLDYGMLSDPRFYVISALYAKSEGDFAFFSEKLQKFEFPEISTEFTAQLLWNLMTDAGNKAAEKMAKGFEEAMESK